ncbi:MAG: hypothetical protein IT267_10635 [Saprospiraceae bacterium]|nr:hypothetical protein [Saprospiraceae bacterium]
MKKSIQILSAIFMLSIVNLFGNSNAPVDKQKAHDQIVVKYGRGSFDCECGRVLIIKGVDRSGNAAIRQFFKPKGSYRYVELKLDEGAATDFSKLWTCEAICNGEAPFIL